MKQVLMIDTISDENSLELCSKCHGTCWDDKKIHKTFVKAPEFIEKVLKSSKKF